MAFRWFLSGVVYDNRNSKNVTKQVNFVNNVIVNATFETEVNVCFGP